MSSRYRFNLTRFLMDDQFHLIGKSIKNQVRSNSNLIEMSSRCRFNLTRFIMDDQFHQIGKSIKNPFRSN